MDRFAVLTTGSRTADARQQTLRATVDWSHDLLTAPEQLLFRRLAVFRGGWTLDAAEHVVTGPDLPPAAVLDLLDRLVRQSLVARSASPAHTRYRMLETLRQYAADKLDLAGEADALSAAHAEFYLALAERGRDRPAQLRATAVDPDPERGTRQRAGRTGVAHRRQTATRMRPCDWQDRSACTGTWAGTSRAATRCAASCR